MKFLIGAAVGVLGGYGLSYWLANSRGIPGAVSLTSPVYNNNSATYPPGYTPPATIPSNATYVSVAPWGNSLTVASTPQLPPVMPS